jgi:7-cyano-7-deazaguanine synthase in queuosine biosynthesis
MLIKNSQQNIEISLPLHVKKVGLKISGGADSAIVGYMLSKYVATERPDIKIIPITVQQVGKNFQLTFAKKIIEFYKKEFGDIFSEHYTDISFEAETYDTTQEKLMAYLYTENIIDVHFNGLSLNPSADIITSMMTYTGWSEPADRIRTGKLKPIYEKTRCSPLINIDKKGIAELYQNLSVLDTLFPLTRSCSAFTDDFSQHCEKCWHCTERFYGFGSKSFGTKSQRS